MDYDKFCKKCKHYNFSLQKGVLCGINNEKPNFAENCEQYEYDPNYEPTQLNDTYKQKKQVKNISLDIAFDLRMWGIGLILLGIIHLFLTHALNPFWGVLIIILGILNLVIQKKEMFIVNGVALLLAGIMNIVGTILLDFSESVWILFGIFQQYLGIKEILKYNSYKKEEIVELKDSLKLISDSEISTAVILNKKNSTFGVSSFAVFCFTLLLSIIILTLIIIYGQEDPDLIELESTHAAIIGFTLIFNTFISFVGIGLGVAGLFQKGKKKKFAILGVVLNLIIFSLLLPTLF